MTSQLSEHELCCLFSVENLYDQPANNLVGCWDQRPTLQQLIHMMGYKPIEELGDETIIHLVNILKGQEVRIGETSYRLQEIVKGVSVI